MAPAPQAETTRPGGSSASLLSGITVLQGLSTDAQTQFPPPPLCTVSWPFAAGAG